MNRFITLLIFTCCFITSNAQDSGTNGLVIGSQSDNTYSALVINGANQPVNENGKRDILFNFRLAGQSIIRSYRGPSWDTYMQFMTTHNDAPGAKVRLHINHNGDIGIGTTTPQEKLDVSGTVKSVNLMTGDIKLGGKLGRELAYPFTYDNVKMDNFSLTWLNDPKVPTEYGYSLWMSSSAGIKFFTSQQPRLTIDTSGNIGIGTTNPQNTLDVNGTIRAKEIKVESGWADFVFDDNYKLPTLEEVAIHIKENKRLPDIPSADEVAKDGVNLGEMNVKLLQKIEELTLYTIQQQELTKSLQNRIEKLESDK